MTTPELVTLTEAQRAYAVQVGSSRFNGMRARGSPLARPVEVGSLTRLEGDIQGACGEVAVCIALGLDYEQQVVDPGGSDPGHDVLYERFRLQVKTASKPHHGLLFTPRKGIKFTADYAVLVVPAHPGATHDWRIAGIISHYKWLAKHYTRDLGHGPTLYTDQCDLRPLGILVDWVAEQAAIIELAVPLLVDPARPRQLRLE